MFLTSECEDGVRNYRIFISRWIVLFCGHQKSVFWLDPLVFEVWNHLQTNTGVIVCDDFFILWYLENERTDFVHLGLDRRGLSSLRFKTRSILYFQSSLTLARRKRCFGKRLGMRMSVRMRVRMTRRDCRSGMRMRSRRRMKNVRSSRVGNWPDGPDVAGSGRRRQLFPESSSTVAEPDLNPRLGKFSPLCQFLSGIYVRVLSPLEGSFELVKLMCCERCPAPPLFSFQRNTRFALAIRTGTRLACAGEQRNNIYWKRNRLKNNNRSGRLPTKCHVSSVCMYTT